MKRKQRIFASSGAGVAVAAAVVAFAVHAPEQSGLEALHGHNVKGVPDSFVAPLNGGEWMCEHPLPAPVLAAQISQLTDLDAVALTEITGAESIRGAILSLAATDCTLLDAAVEYTSSDGIKADPVSVMLSMSRCGIEASRAAGGICDGDTAIWVDAVTDAARFTFDDGVPAPPA